MKNKIYGPFALREKLMQEEMALNRVHGIVFISDAKNNDWYSLQKQFAMNSLKIVFDDTGLINSASYDASTLWPQGFFVSEVAQVPEGFSLPVPGGKWVFDGTTIAEKIMTAAELIAHAEQIRAEKIAAASAAIAPLQDAVELECATDDEKARLPAWKKYRVDLSRLDISAPEISWPEAPGDLA